VFRLRIGGLFVFISSEELFGLRVSLGVAREERRCGVSEDFRSWRSSSRDIFLTAFPVSMLWTAFHSERATPGSFS